MQIGRVRETGTIFLRCRSHRKKTGKEKELTGGKKRGKLCESEAKKIGDRERGKV
jgi:hypothetical protein